MSRWVLLLLFTPKESAGFMEEDKHLTCLRARNDRSSWGGVELEVEAGFFADGCCRAEAEFCAR